MERYKAVSRITSIIAAIIAVTVACTVPLAYFTITYQYSAGSIDAEAALTSWRIAGLIAANPTMWSFEEIRLQELLHQRHNSEIERAYYVRDVTGGIVAGSQESVSAPFIMRSRDLYDAGSRVGVIEITESLRPLFIKTMLLAILSSALGIAIYFVLRMLPLRALERAQNELDIKEKELQKKERYERALLDNFPFMVWLKDTEGRYLSVNRFFVEAAGARDADDLRGKSDFDITSSDRAGRAEAEERAVMSLGRQQISEEMTEHQGMSRWTEIYRAPVIEEDGKLLGTVGFSRDITERKENEKEHLKIEKLESVGILAGGIAHDFNNILTGIMGNIALARMFLDNTHKSFGLLVEAEKASVRASDLAHQLLTFSRGGEPIKKVISVRQLINEAASLLLRGTNVKAVVEVPDSVHAIEADEGQMNQILSNLIINAVQAMPGGGTLTIAAENETVPRTNTLLLEPGPYVCISIRDEGCGISDADLTRIFDPYFSTKMAGRGLGLATVYSIVKKHGGHIGASSALNRGTTFRIYLPSAGEDRAAGVAALSPDFSGDHKGGSILVMDDEKIVLKLAEEMLQFLGYEVTTCANGEEAIALYQKAKEAGTAFNAAILDLTIPAGMGGKETAGRILEADPRAVLIVSSGYSNDTIMADYRKFGFSGVLAKPYKPADLAQVLDALLKPGASCTEARS